MKTRKGKELLNLLLFHLAPVLLAAVLLTVSVLLQRLERKNGWRLDCSFNGVTTQTETTKRILEGLEHQVHIYALFPKGEEDLPLMELLDRYAAASERITWEQTDLALNPGLLTKFSPKTAGEQEVSSDSIIVYCPDTERWRILTPADFISLGLNDADGSYRIAGLTYELSLTTAISYVAQEHPLRAVFLQGHGELSPDVLAPLTELLTRNRFDVAFLELKSAAAVLTEQDIVFAVSPITDLMDTEFDKLTAWCGQGGSLFITCDYTDDLSHMTNWQALLRYYGFLPKEGIVVASEEEPDSYYTGYPIFLLPDMLSTDATIDLLSAGASTLLLPGACALGMPEEADAGLDVRPVLMSGSKAYRHVLDQANLSIDRSEGDEEGPFVLAAQAQRLTAGGFISRAFIIGCSPLLTDTQVQSMTDAQEFILSMIRYLSQGQSASLDIMAKTAVRPQLSARSVWLGSLMAALLPMAVIIFSLAVLIPRYRRK